MSNPSYYTDALRDQTFRKERAAERQSIPIPNVWRHSPPPPKGFLRQQKKNLKKAELFA